MTVRFPVSYGRLWKDFPPHQNPSSQNPVGKTFPVPSQYCPGGQSIQSVSAKAPENGMQQISFIFKYCQVAVRRLNFTSQILIHLQCSYKLEISSSKSPTKVSWKLSFYAVSFDSISKFINFFMKGDILTLKNLYMTYPRILFKKYNTQFLLTPMDNYIDKVCDVFNALMYTRLFSPSVIFTLLPVLQMASPSLKFAQIQLC